MILSSGPRTTGGVLIAALLALPVATHASDWAPDGCDDAPTPPAYHLRTRDEYNDAVAQVTAYQRDARAYSACVISHAHADEAAISKAAQNRIATIQATAVAMQQEIYGRFTAQTAAFKAAAARLKGK